MVSFLFSGGEYGKRAVCIIALFLGHRTSYTCSILWNPLFSFALGHLLLRTWQNKHRGTAFSLVLITLFWFSSHVISSRHHCFLWFGLTNVLFFDSSSVSLRLCEGLSNGKRAFCGPISKQMKLLPCKGGGISLCIKAFDEQKVWWYSNLSSFLCWSLYRELKCNAWVLDSE